jgi:hypothetical protein
VASLTLAPHFQRHDSSPSSAGDRPSRSQDEPPPQHWTPLVRSRDRLGEITETRRRPHSAAPSVGGSTKRHVPSRQSTRWARKSPAHHLTATGDKLGGMNGLVVRRERARSDRGVRAADGTAVSDALEDRHAIGDARARSVVPLRGDHVGRPGLRIARYERERKQEIDREMRELAASSSIGPAPKLARRRRAPVPRPSPRS